MSKLTYPEYEADRQLFGLKKYFTKKELEKAFRKLSLSCHPDKPNNSADEFKSLSSAKDRLAKTVESPDNIFEYFIMFLQFILLIKFFYNNPRHIPHDFFEAYQKKSFTHMVERMNKDAENKKGSQAEVNSSDSSCKTPVMNRNFFNKGHQCPQGNMLLKSASEDGIAHRKKY